MVGIHHDIEATRRLDLLAVHRLTDRVHLRGPRLSYRLDPHLEADVSRLHGVVGHTFRVLDKGMPLLDEDLIHRRVYRLEIVPGGEVADQVFCVDTGKLLLTDGKGHHGDILCLDPLIGKLLVEWHVGIAVDRGDDRGFFAGGGELLDIRYDGLPVGVAEGGIVDHNVFGLHSLRLEKGLEDFVRSAWVNIVGTGQHPALHIPSIFAHQVLHRGDGLLVRRRTGVKDVP